MFSSFLVIDKGDFSTRDPEVTLSGAVYFNVGAVVPIMVRNEGCIGIAKIKCVTITETSTTVIYEPTRNIPDESKKAYYNLYKNNIGQGSTGSDDVYDQQDVTIPGALGRSKKKSRHEENRSFFNNDRRERSGSLSDVLDEDDDW